MVTPAVTPPVTPTPQTFRRKEFEKKKPPNFGGLGERETGLEPPWADLTQTLRVGGFG